MAGSEYINPNDILRAQAKLIALREAATDMLDLIQSGALVPATDDTVLLDRCTDIANRLERASAPDAIRPIIYQD